MASKKALSKAYDAGQAAQAGGFAAEGCPFASGSDEADAWLRGFDEELAEKWQTPGSRITVTIEEQS